MKNLSRQFVLLLVTLIQSIFAGAALLLFIMAFTSSEGDASAVIMYIVIAGFLFITSTIPAKIALKMKGKCGGDKVSREIYFNNTEGRLRRKVFKDWAEIPLLATVVWYLLGSVAVFIQLIAIIIALLSLVIPPLHSRVGLPEYFEYKAEGFQDFVSVLFNFVVGGIPSEQWFAKMDEIMKDVKFN